MNYMGRVFNFLKKSHNIINLSMVKINYLVALINTALVFKLISRPVK